MKLVQRSVLSAMVLAISTGCAGKTYLRNAATADASGVAHYYAPKDVIEVELTATENHSKGWYPTNDTSSPDYCKAGPKKVVLKQVAVDLNTRTVADTRNRFTIQVHPASFSSSKLSLTTTPEGLLTAFGTSATDDRAEFAGNVIKIVSGVAGTVVGLDALKQVSLQNVSQIQTLIANDTTALVKAALSRSRDRGEHCAIERLGGVVAGTLIERDVLESQLAEVRNARQVYMSEYKTAKDANALKVVQGVDELFAGRQASLESRLKTVSEQIASTVTQFKQNTGIAVRDSIRKANAVLDAAHVPDWTARPSLRNEVEVRHALHDYPEVLELYTGTGLVLSAAPIMTGATLEVTRPTNKEKLRCTAPSYEAQDCVVLYTRYARPVRLEVLGRANDGALTLMHSRFMQLVSSNDPLLAVALPSSVIGSKETKVLMARPGVVTGIDNERPGSAKDAAASIVSALSASRTEFASGLESVKSAQLSYSAIEQAQRTKRIQELTDKRLLLEADLALAGANSNKQLVADKQRIDAELALLTAQQSLAAQQTAGATAPDLAALKAELERLKLQLELTKIQLELEKAKQSKSS